MTKQKTSRMNLLYVAVILSIVIWLVFEDWRRPPSEAALLHAYGVIDSVTDAPIQYRTHRQQGERFEMRLRGHSQGYMFFHDQPGFPTVRHLRMGDEVYLQYDPWPLSLPESLHVYSLSVNGKVVATYDQTVAAQKSGIYTGKAVLLVLISLLFHRIRKRRRGSQTPEG